MMAFWEKFRGLVRYWPVLLIGALVTAGAGYVAATEDGVFFTRTELVLLAPTSTSYPNALRTQSEDVVITAGAIAKMVAGPDAITKFASSDVTLVGMGIREGWSLRLPDTGGQWGTNFQTQRIFLDVVGPTHDEVEQKQQEIIARVSDALYDFQRSAGVDPAADITVIAAPETTVINHIGGSRARTLGGTAALGLAATFAVILLLDRRRQFAGATALPSS